MAGIFFLKDWGYENLMSGLAFADDLGVMGAMNEIRATR